MANPELSEKDIKVDVPQPPVAGPSQARQAAPANLVLPPALRNVPFEYGAPLPRDDMPMFHFGRPPVNPANGGGGVVRPQAAQPQPQPQPQPQIVSGPIRPGRPFPPFRPADAAMFRVEHIFNFIPEAPLPPIPQVPFPFPNPEPGRAYMALQERAVPPPRPRAPAPRHEPRVTRSAARRGAPPPDGR